MSYLEDADLIEVREIRLPRGASRFYTLTVNAVSVDPNGVATIGRQTLTGATVFLVVKTDTDDAIEVFRRTSGQSYGSIGRIECIPAASHVDGETFTLDDGSNPAITFEFDVAGDGVGGGNEAIDISALTTEDEVRDKIIEVINATASFDITAAILTDGQVRLYGLDATGYASNTSSSDTVADSDFVVTDMTGGIADGFEILTQSGDTLGQAVLHLNKPATEDINAPKDYVFSIWVVIPDGRQDAVLDAYDFKIDKRVPITVP